MSIVAMARKARAKRLTAQKNANSTAARKNTNQSYHNYLSNKCNCKGTAVYKDMSRGNNVNNHHSFSGGVTSQERTDQKNLQSRDCVPPTSKTTRGTEIITKKVQTVPDGSCKIINRYVGQSYKYIQSQRQVCHTTAVSPLKKTAHDHIMDKKSKVETCD